MSVLNIAEVVAAYHKILLNKTGGYSGDGGDKAIKANETKGLSVPTTPKSCTHSIKAVGTGFDGGGYEQSHANKGFSGFVPTVPAVPTDFNDFKRSENDGNVNNDLTTAERFDLWQKVEIRRLINELCDTAPHSQSARKEMLNSIAGLSSTGVPQALKLYRRCLAQVANGSYWSFKDNELHDIGALAIAC
jgi:hypothetical protein